MGRILDRYFHRKSLERWQRLTKTSSDAAFPDLRRHRDEARQLRKCLDQVIQSADGRLMRPWVGSSQFPKPLGTDWSWRPDLWREPLARPGLAAIPRKAKIDTQVTVFHDCNLSETTIRQSRNRRDNDLAPFSLSVETFGFEGSFLSLSVELPAIAATGLTGQHLIRVDTQIESERPAVIFARLNIQHGPNTEQVLRQLELSASTSGVDFDLSHLSLNERRIEKLWLDLIIEEPEMNRISLRDLTFCRHHRADL